MSSAVANGFAGAGGGLIAQILTYPLQTVYILSYFALCVKKFLAYVCLDPNKAQVNLVVPM